MEKSFSLFSTAQEKSATEAVQMLFDDRFWNFYVPSTEFPDARKLFEEIAKENSRSFLIGGGIEGAKTIQMSGVGHTVNMEKPEKFNKIVYNFLSNL